VPAVTVVGSAIGALYATGANGARWKPAAVSHLKDHCILTATSVLALFPGELLVAAALMICEAVAEVQLIFHVVALAGEAIPLMAI
jgi:hypothetical protein